MSICLFKRLWIGKSWWRRNWGRKSGDAAQNTPLEYLLFLLAKNTFNSKLRQIMTAIFEGVASNFIFDLLKDGATKISKTDCIRKFKRKNHFSTPHQNDFFDLYQDAIIEIWYLGKPNEVVGFFKNESICKAFYDLFYSPEKDFWLAINHAIESLKVGDEIKSTNADIQKEIEDFRKIFNDLVTQSRNLKEIEDTRKLDDIKRILEKQSEGRDKKRLTLLPSPPPHFIGRLDKLAELDEFLRKGKNATLINGMGGMGKTTIAQQYVNLPEYTDRLKHLAWVTLNTGLKDDILKEFHNRDGQFCYDQNQTADENYRRLLVLLQNLDGPNLLVLDDNLNQTGIFDEFGINNWQVLVCSRTIPEGFHKIDVDELSVSDARELFYAHYHKTRNDELVDRIVQTVARHTLTVELLAKIANNNASLTLEKILAGLAEKGLSFDEGTKIRSPYDKARNKKYIKDCLDAAFNIAEAEHYDDKELIKFLLWFSVMPSDFISFEMLCELFVIHEKEQTNFSNRLNALSDLGWITGNQQSYRMHSVVQDIVRRRLQPSVENCNPIIINLSWKLKPEPSENPLNKAKYIPYSIALFQQIDAQHNNIADLANNLSVIYRNMGNLPQALEFQLKVIEIKEKVLEPNHPDLATAYNNLALVYWNIGNLKDAMKSQEKAIKIHQRNSPQDQLSMATAYNNLTLISKDMGDLENALKFQNQAKSIFEKTLSVDHPYLATSYNNLSSIYRAMGDTLQALKYQNLSRNIREKILEPDHPDLATSFNNLSLIYRDMGNLPKALEFQLKAKEIQDKIQDKNHPQLASCYNNLCSIYYEMKEYKKAGFHINKAVEIFKKALPKQHPDIQRALDWQKLIEEKLEKTTPHP